MPYENEWSCRLNDPSKYNEWGSVEWEHNGKTYRVIRGHNKETKEWEDQSFRYPKKTWLRSQANEHCSSHEGKFEGKKCLCDLVIDEVARMI
jgi:hypothetical protein